MPARFNGRTNSRNSSGSGIGEDSARFRLKFIRGPIGMLGTESGYFHPSRRPIELLGETQSPLPWNPPQDFKLLWARLLIW